MSKDERMAWLFRALFFITFAVMSLIQDADITKIQKIVEHLK